MISPGDIGAAAARIAPYCRRTPILDLEADSLGIGHAVTLKLEQLQVTGSFKVRGAFNNLLAHPLPAAGVVAISGGNHGAAVGYAAARLGARARVFVPGQIADAVKIARMQSLGAEVEVTEGSVDDGFRIYNAYANDTGALAVHPYGSPETVTGQGTLGLELEQQAPDLDTILVAVGGGGLIGGIAAYFAGRKKIVAVETEGTRSLDLTLRGIWTPEFKVSGIAKSGLGASSIAPLPLEIIRAHVAENVVVSDRDVIEAQRRLWAAARVVAEPGGVTAMAALTSGVYRPDKGERVGVVICGGNAAPNWFETETSP